MENQYYNTPTGDTYLETYTFKADADLREALRDIAYEQTKAGTPTTSSSLIRTILGANPLVASKLEQIKKTKKNRVK